jgi:hypothetical protein
LVLCSINHMQHQHPFKGEEAAADADNGVHGWSYDAAFMKTHAAHPQHVLLRGMALTARRSLPSMYTSNRLVLSSSRKLTTAALQQ